MTRAESRTLLQPIKHAAQCAATLVGILAAIGLIAWMAGIAALADLPWVLAGAFMGSFVVAAFRRDPRPAGRR